MYVYVINKFSRSIHAFLTILAHDVSYEYEEM